MEKKNKTESKTENITEINFTSSEIDRLTEKYQDFLYCDIEGDLDGE